MWASLEASKDSFISDVNEEMNRRDPRGEKLRVVVMDGERALHRRVYRIMKGVVLVLDFLHVLEIGNSSPTPLYSMTVNAAVLGAWLVVCMLLAIRLFSWE